jgi:DNA modification methylase
MSTQFALNETGRRNADIATRSLPSPATGLTFEERRILKLLRTCTYDEVRQQTGWSRGRIYNLAIRVGARKTEARIKERHAERRRRQVDFLNEIINTTIKCDVLDFLDGLPNDALQLVLTSCPYNMGKPHGDCPSADRMRFTYYHGFLMQVISEISRTLAPAGTLFLNLGSTRDWQDNLMPLDILLFEDIRRAGLTFQSRIIWTIPHGLTPKRRLAERHETFLVCSKGEQQTFNPTAARIPQKEPHKRAFKGPNKGQLSCHPLGAHPTNVWNIPNVGHNHTDRKYTQEKHPAPFPLLLAKRGILLYTMPGDLVCDPFSGSGTTQHAAIQTGRAFVGADLFYEDMRAQRLAHALPDLVCELPGVTDTSIAVWQAEARKVEIPASLITAQQEARMIQKAFL